MQQQHFCYCLHSPDGRARSYVGYTVDPLRRLRQHNGELRGGARRTRRANSWTFSYIVQVDSDRWTKHMALSLEWHLKGRRGTRWRGDTGGSVTTLDRSLQLLARALFLPKFREFLADVVVWVRDGDMCDDAWVAIDEMSDAFGMTPALAPCVLPIGQGRFGGMGPPPL